MDHKSRDSFSPRNSSNHVNPYAQQREYSLSHSLSNESASEFIKSDSSDIQCFPKSDLSKKRTVTVVRDSDGIQREILENYSFQDMLNRFKSLESQKTTQSAFTRRVSCHTTVSVQKALLEEAMKLHSRASTNSTNSKSVLKKGNISEPLQTLSNLPQVSDKMDGESHNGKEIFDHSNLNKPITDETESMCSHQTIDCYKEKPSSFGDFLVTLSHQSRQIEHEQVLLIEQVDTLTVKVENLTQQLRMKEETITDLKHTLEFQISQNSSEIQRLSQLLLEKEEVISLLQSHVFQNELFPTAENNMKCSLVGSKGGIETSKSKEEEEDCQKENCIRRQSKFAKEENLTPSIKMRSQSENRFDDSSCCEISILKEDLKILKGDYTNCSSRVKDLENELEILLEEMEEKEEESRRLHAEITFLREQLEVCNDAFFRDSEAVDYQQPLEESSFKFPSNSSPSSLSPSYPQQAEGAPQSSLSSNLVRQFQPVNTATSLHDALQVLPSPRFSSSLGAIVGGALGRNSFPKNGEDEEGNSSIEELQEQSINDLNRLSNLTVQTKKEAQFVHIPLRKYSPQQFERIENFIFRQISKPTDCNGKNENCENFKVFTGTQLASNQTLSEFEALLSMYREELLSSFAEKQRVKQELDIAEAKIQNLQSSGSSSGLGHSSNSSAAGLERALTETKRLVSLLTDELTTKESELDFLKEQFANLQKKISCFPQQPQTGMSS
eukprot:GDKJ01014913.1.p1 GENE.GDKJ01014913.1~~GDKJ01014913.1.p1  ORF type:complete len:725 (-),score=148.12 GDKJ01014913.1:90-2264(-)